MRAVKYEVDIEVFVAERGNGFWAIVDDYRNVMNKYGEWEYEPLPSSRTIGFINRTRFETAEAANYFYHKVKAEKSQPEGVE